MAVMAQPSSLPATLSSSSYPVSNNVSISPGYTSLTSEGGNTSGVSLEEQQPQQQQQQLLSLIHI